MDLFEGLSAQQLSIIRHCRVYKKFYENEVIFHEGDVAESLFTIVSGSVQIFRRTAIGDVEIAELGHHEIFGEMGLLVNSGRTASARSLGETILFEIPSNIVEVMRRTCPPEATLRMLENLVCILSERLRKQNELAQSDIGDSVMWMDMQAAHEDTTSALKTLERNLPSGLIKRFTHSGKLKRGDILINEGEDPDGFYFIHKGSLEVLKPDEHTGEMDRVAVINGPTITGELGFFSGQKRSATLRAVSEVSFTHFSGKHFHKMKASDPIEASNVLLASAQLAIHLTNRR